MEDKRGRNKILFIHKSLPTSSQWIRACRRAYRPVKPNVYRICSMHYLNNDFLRYLRCELTEYSGRKKLPKQMQWLLEVPGILCYSSEKKILIFKVSATSEKNPKTKINVLIGYRRYDSLRGATSPGHGPINRCQRNPSPSPTVENLEQRGLESPLQS